MNKKMKIFIYLFVALVLTGCGKKQVLICTDVDDYDFSDLEISFTETTEYRITYVNGEIDQYNQKIDMVFNDLSAEEIEEECELDDFTEYYEEYENIDYQFICNNNGDTEEINVSINELTEEEISELWLENVIIKTIEELEEEMTGYGYTCEIK